MLRGFERSSSYHNGVKPRGWGTGNFQDFIHQYILPLVIIIFYYIHFIELYQYKQIALFGGKRWLALVDLSSPNCQVNHLNII